MSQYDPNALTDESLMPIGIHKGKRLGDIPDDYWEWFLKQDWCDKYPAIVQYANNVSDD